MLLGVRRQSGILLAVNDSEPQFPPGDSVGLVGYSSAGSVHSSRIVARRIEAIPSIRAACFGFPSATSAVSTYCSNLRKNSFCPSGIRPSRLRPHLRGRFMLDSDKLWLGTRPTRLQALEHQIETRKGGEGEVCARGLRLICRRNPGGLELLSQALPVLAPAPAEPSTPARHRRRDRREGLRRGRRGHQDVRTVSLQPSSLVCPVSPPLGAGRSSKAITTSSVRT